jgi:hypothetical protein
VLTGAQILKRYKLFNKHMMNTLIPMLPKNIREIPSGNQLWEAFDNVSIELYKKRHKVLLAKKHKTEKTTPPPANEDEAMKKSMHLQSQVFPMVGCIKKYTLKSFCFQ